MYLSALLCTLYAKPLALLEILFLQRRSYRSIACLAVAAQLSSCIPLVRISKPLFDLSINLAPESVLVERTTVSRL